VLRASRLLRVLLLTGLLLCLLGVLPAGHVAGTASTADNASVVAVHPNPIADEDTGEFVVVRARNATLSDGEGKIRVNDTAVFSPDPAAARNLTDRRPVYEMPLALANGGERLVLTRGNATLDTLTYEDAPEGETLENGTWRPPGATAFDPVTARGVSIKTFVFPDAPGPPLDAIRSAEQRLLVGAYTLTSARVTDALVAAENRGVNVGVLVEGGPVGGVVRRQAMRLDALRAAGASVRVVASPGARHRFHHAKYAVADDRVFVGSENWKASGVGGHGTRGWGAVVESASLADRLAAAFHADSDARNSQPWATFRANRTFRATNRSRTTYPSRIDTRLTETNATLLFAPDNAESRVLELLENAEEELLVELASVSPESPLFDALLAAAARGVRVRVALNGAWYAREENQRIVTELNRRAHNRSLPLDARVVDPRSRFSAVHAKGVVVDGERALVGSMNWNNVSARENREVGLLIEGKRAVTPYRRAFRADWRGGVWRAPAGAAVVLGGCALLVPFVFRRRVRFGS